MGQKVHPKGLRVGITKQWGSTWFAKRNYQELLQEDLFLRKYINERMKRSGISKIVIERKANKVRIIISTGRPGIIIGRSGSGVERLRRDIEKELNNRLKSKDRMERQVEIIVHEITEPQLDAQLVAENIATQLEKRLSRRFVMKQAITRAMDAGAKGIKILISGRIDGAEIARHEGYKQGKIPLHTLKANIDYGFAEAATTYGNIGVKVWIYKGEVEI